MSRHAHSRSILLVHNSRLVYGLQRVNAISGTMTDSSNEFTQYIERFERLVGDIQTGQYGQFKGRLVRRLNSEEFEMKANEYDELGQRFNRILDNGDTIDEGLTVSLRGVEVELVMEKSRFLP